MKTRRLQLPDGGYFQIPMYGLRGSFMDSTPAFGETPAACPHLAATVLISVGVGLLVGGTAAWLILRK